MNKIKELFNKIKGNNWTPYVIKYGLFAISSIYTILLFRSQGYTEFSKFLQSILGGIIELAKYTLPVIAIVGVILGRKVNPALRIIAGCMAIACFYYSIMATQGYQLIDISNINRNEYRNSDEYKAYNDKIERTKEQIQLKKELLKNALTTKEINTNNTTTQSADISRKIDEYNKSIKQYQAQIDTKNVELKNAIAKNFWGQQERLNSEIKQLKDLINKSTVARDSLKVNDTSLSDNNTISKLSAEIDTLNNNLNTLSVNTTNTQKQGYDILFDSQEAINKFFFWLAFLIECIGIFFAIIVGLKEKESPAHIERPSVGIGMAGIASKDNKLVLAKMQPIPPIEEEKFLKPKNPIGFGKNPESHVPKEAQVTHKENSTIQKAKNLQSHVPEDEELKEYIAEMEKTAKQTEEGRECISYRKIAENAGVKDSARKIFEYLKLIGKIRVVGTTTYIND